MACNPPPTSGADGTPPAKRRKFNYDFTKTFDVLVGKEPDQQRFTVYHDLLTQRSEFFRAARSGRWTKKPDQPTTLDDHEPEIFSVYLHCVNFGAEALQEQIDAMPMDDDGDDSDYSSDSDSSSDDSSSEGDSNEDSNERNGKNSENEDGKQNLVEEVSVVDAVAERDVNASNTGDDGSSENGSSNSSVLSFYDSEYTTRMLVDLYLLADKLLDPVTANLAIDSLIQRAEKTDRYPSINMVKYVYSSTVTESPLRKLLRDWYIYDVEKEWTHSCSYPYDFMQDLLHEVYNLQRDNKRKRIENVFGPDKYVDRPKDHYHQKIEKPSGEAAMPEPGQ